MQVRFYYFALVGFIFIYRDTECAQTKDRVWTGDNILGFLIGII